MFEYIKKIQQKDEITRKKIMMISMIIVVLIVGSVWIYSLTDLFNNGEDKIAQEEEREDLKPFTLFKNSMKDTYNNVSASVGKISLPKYKDLDFKESDQIDLIVIDKATE